MDSILYIFDVFSLESLFFYILYVLKFLHDFTCKSLQFAKKNMFNNPLNTYSSYWNLIKEFITSLFSFESFSDFKSSDISDHCNKSEHK